MNAAYYHPACFNASPSPSAAREEFRENSGDTIVVHPRSETFFTVTVLL